MTTSARRPLAALTLAALCAAPWLQPLHAEAAAPAVNARHLDLSAEATRPLADGLDQDLGPLLAAAQYHRHKDDPAAPRNSITSVDRVANALRAHRGVAYVALAERKGNGAAVTIRALYVLEGAPIGGAGGSAPAAPASADTPGKAAINLDLTGAAAKPLVQSLHGHLGALLPPAGQGATTTVEEVITALRTHSKVAFVVLAERRETMVDRSQVFVAPDVLRINITDEAMAMPAAPSPEKAPEVEIVPGKEGGPPRIKFEFDPDQYDITKKK